MAIVPIEEVQELVVEVVPLTPRPTGVEMTIECTLQENMPPIKFGDPLDACNRACDHVEHSKLSELALVMTRKHKVVFSPESFETEYSSSDPSSDSVCSNHVGEFYDCACRGVVRKHNIVIIHLSSNSDCSVHID